MIILLKIRASIATSIILGGLMLCAPVNAQQSRLPVCPKDEGLFWSECYGSIILPNGGKYVGEFLDNQFNGNGTLTFPDGDEYKGEWKEGKHNGQGTLTLPGGDKYIAVFRNNKPNGPGTYTSSDGTKYTGEFSDWKFSGHGTLNLSDGSVYVGEFKDGKENGQGTLTYPDGYKYVGEWKEGKRNGQGSLTMPDGDKYIAVFRNNKPNGRGTYISFDGYRYVGEFKDWQYNGQGTLTYPDGYKYVGEWQGGKRNGHGIYYGTNGSILKMGIWADGIFIRQANVNPAPQPSSAPQASSGTAFRVSNGQFVTNHHVIEGCNTLKVGGYQGGRVLASDTINDLALISVPNDSGEIASIRTTRTQLNEAVTAAGFPLQSVFLGIAITNGTVSRLSGLKGDTGQVQISAPVQPGNSGGPLLDSAGNVIGVVSSKLNAVKVAGLTGDIPQNVNFAISSNALRAFLDAKGANYKEVGRESDLRGEQIAARAGAFTVLVECR